MRSAALLLVALVLAGCGGATHTTPAPPAPRVGPPANARGPDWPTYHADPGRTGAAAAGPDPGHVRRLWSAPVDGAVYAQPLVAAAHIVVATENDSLYSFDSSGRTQWRTHLGTPVRGADLPCGDIDPSGITGTPAIAGDTVYAVTLEAPAHHTLVAVDLRTGAVRWRRAIDAPGSNPVVQQQRAALAVANGRVYVAYGGLFGDCGDYNGWVVAADARGDAAVLRTYRVPSSRKGGIWAPSGPALDRSGNLYVSTGNGVSSSFDFGNAVIRLSPALARTGFFAPRNAADLNGPDVDLGSVGPVLLPAGRLFVAGKDGTGYLTSQAHLGGIGGELRSRQVCAGSGAFGGLAIAGGLIYVPCTSGVVAIRAADLAPVWSGPRWTPGAPIVAGRAVWAVDTGGGALYALDATTGAVRFRGEIGSPAHFATPATAAGRIYVAAGGRLMAFG